MDVIMKFRKSLSFTVLSAFCLSAHATTYFVDSELGDDNLSGQTATVSGTNGPWQTLAKVAATKLAPGDNILLSCDRTWNETLAINQSGTADLPIKIAAADQNCINPPTISGLQSIPDYAWQQHGNGIWKVKFPYSLVRNGLLSEGKKYWSIWSASNDATISNTAFTCSTGKTAPCLNINTTNSTGLISSAPFALEKGATYNVSFSSFLTMDSNVSKWSVWSPAQDLAIKTGAACLNNQTGSCLTVASNTSVGLLSSNSFSITQGQSYTLTFSAYIPTGKTAKVIVRQSSGSFSTLGLSSSLSGTGSWKSYTHTFTATATETAARLDFEIPTASTIQFQKVKLNLPLTPTKAFVRQNGGSYQNLGLAAATNNLDGVWKDSTYTFTATGTSANARLDFEVPSNSAAQIQNIVVSKVQGNLAVSQLLDNDVPQGIAHHPNRGYDITNPNSMFLKTTATSSTVTDATGKKGSNYLTTGSDLVLPVGTTITAETPITIRNTSYDMSNVKVTAVNGTKISFSPNTNAPLYWAGLGYYFTNQPWMVDSASEWYFDKTNQILYYYPNTPSPENNIKLATSLTGAALNNKSYIQINGINFNGLETGIDASYSKNIVLNDLNISNINTVGIQGESANTLTLQNSTLTRIGQEGIVGRNSDNVVVSNNNFDQIGVILDSSGKVVSIPTRSIGAIVLRQNATVSQNSIKNFGYHGINTHANSLIKNNSLSHGCLVLSDCGGIYIGATAVGTKITGNLVSDLVGNVNGLPNQIFPLQTAGLYTDNGANGNTISGNTVSYAGFSLLLHESYNQTVQNNLLFGARVNEIFVQESGKFITPTGDIHNLAFSNNLIFPVNSTSQLKLQSTVTSLDDFGVFDEDNFSNYYTPNVATEMQTVTTFYTLPQWQAATYNGTLRNIEPNGKVTAPLANYALGYLQSNILPNANFQNKLDLWTGYGSSGTAPTLSLTTCNPQTTSVPCVKLDASTVAGNLATPKFDIQKDHDYFLSFDVRSSDSTQIITAIVRQAGPSYFNSLMIAPLYGTQGTTGWKRYSIIFRAKADALTNGSVPGVSGARIDFTGINAGQSIWLANLELVPVGQQSLPKSATIISNHSFAPHNYDCPSSDTFLCNNYINFATASKVNWPVSLPALGSMVVYTQSLDYPDSDTDGIPNSQDSCIATAIGAAVNSKGCGL